MALCERDKVSWEAAPAAQFHRGSSSDQTDRGACRMEGFVLREDVPDGLGQLASEVDPGDLGAALAPEALLRALVSLHVANIASGVVAASTSAQRRYLGPFFASGPRRSFGPDWRTSGHRPVYPASFLGVANRVMSPISDAIV